MGRKIEFFIDNDNGNVKIKDYLKHNGVSHRMLCVLKRTENGILKNGVGARSIDILNSGDTLTLICRPTKAPPPLSLPIYRST